MSGQFGKVELRRAKCNAGVALSLFALKLCGTVSCSWVRRGVIDVSSEIAMPIDYTAGCVRNAEG